MIKFGTPTRGLERLEMENKSILDLDETELGMTLSPPRPMINPLNVLAEVAGNIRGSATRGAQFVDGSVASRQAESNVGAVGNSMPLDADGGRGRRSCEPEVEIPGLSTASKDRLWLPMKADRSSVKSDRRVHVDQSDRKSRGTHHRSRGRSSSPESAEDTRDQSVDRLEVARRSRVRDDDDRRETSR